MSAEEVHNRISMLRVERGISRKDLAGALGVHYQTVGYLEREYSPASFSPCVSPSTSMCRWKSSSPSGRSPGLEARQ